MGLVALPAVEQSHVSPPWTASSEAFDVVGPRGRGHGTCDSRQLGTGCGIAIGPGVARLRALLQLASQTRCVSVGSPAAADSTQREVPAHPDRPVPGRRADRPRTSLKFSETTATSAASKASHPRRAPAAEYRHHHLVHRLGLIWPLHSYDFTHTEGLVAHHVTSNELTGSNACRHGAISLRLRGREVPTSVSRRDRPMGRDT